MSLAQTLKITAIMCAGACLLETCQGSRDAARRASCRPQSVLYTCERYARQHRGLFPPLSMEPGKLMVEGAAVADFLLPLYEYDCEQADACSDDDALFFNTQYTATNPILVDDCSYAYLGYALENETQGLAFLETYTFYVAKGLPWPEDFLRVEEGKGNGGSAALHRLQSAPQLKRIVGADFDPSVVPVSIEWPGHHRKPGGHVVYLDGHREYVSYPGKFPMTPQFMERLRELNKL